MLESLVKAGAFDFLGRDRADLFARIEDSLASSAAAHRDRAAGQVSLFNDLMQPAQSRRREPIAPWSERERMTYEKELLGFYVTGHPLDAYAALFAVEKYQPISSLSELPDRSVFRIAGAIAQVDRKFTKKEGKPFAVVWLEDLTGTIEVVLWNEVFVKVSDALQVGAVIALKGTLDKRDDTVRATAQKAKVLTTENEPKGSDGFPAQAAEMAVRLRFSTGTTPDELREVREILTSSPGHQPVQLVFGRPTGEALCLDAGNEFRISLTPELERRLSPWLSFSADAQDEKSFDAIDSIA
jgi:DNA polymerase-3 subunit alpha